MYGMDIDTLNIYIKVNGQLGKPVWTRARNQGSFSSVKMTIESRRMHLCLGNQWLKGQYAIFPPANVKYQIVFEGIVGQYVLHWKEFSRHASVSQTLLATISDSASAISQIGRAHV